MNRCKDCKYHDEYTWACCNGDSPYRADYTDNNFECEVFEMVNHNMVDSNEDVEYGYSWEEASEILGYIKECCETSSNCKYCDFVDKDWKCIFKRGDTPEKWDFDEWRGNKEGGEFFNE